MAADSNFVANLLAGFNGAWMRKLGAEAARQLALALDSSLEERLSGVGSGAVLQHVSFTDATFRSGATAVPVDDSIPQNTEGNALFSVSITPTNATSILVVQCYLNSVAASATDQITAFLHKSGAHALSVATTIAGVGLREQLVLRHSEVAGTTSAVEFFFRIGANASTVAVNGDPGGTRMYGGASFSSVDIWEVIP